MYGKHFASLYEGSMVGAGSHVFALMGYIIAHWKPDAQVGGQVRLNPMLLAMIFGETEKRVQEAIDYLCAPDPRSTTPDEEGRRLIKIGQFDYRVVNAVKYHEIRSEESRREANRERQIRHREKTKKRKSSGTTLAAKVYEKTAQEHGYEAADDTLKETPVEYRANGG